MIPAASLERIVYALAIVLSLIFLALAAISPPDFMDASNVYQGF
jgi:hypothetical protein